MLGKRSDQRSYLEADHLYLDHVGRRSFYGFLASLRGQLFRGEEFARAQWLFVCAVHNVMKAVRYISRVRKEEAALAMGW